VHLVGFIIRIYHDTRSPERQISMYGNVLLQVQLLGQNTTPKDLLFRRKPLNMKPKKKSAVSVYVDFCPRWY